MLEAREEALDLITNPLPQLAIVEPLTRVWEIDKQIAAKTLEIETLQEERKEALDYAVKEQIAEDENCRLDVKIKRFRTLDPAKFREAFPEEFMTACDIERREKEEALNHLGERINLTLIDKLVKKEKLAAAPGVVTVKESIIYGVVRK